MMSDSLSVDVAKTVKPLSDAESLASYQASLRTWLSSERLDRTCLAIGFADLYKSDSQAEHAARLAARKAGEPKPDGLLEHVAANILAVRGHLWRESQLGERRMRIAMWEAAIAGAESYLEGAEGNEYAEFLRQRFGPTDESRMPFRFKHWWVSKEWSNPWYWTISLVMGFIAIMPWLDKDLGPLMQQTGLSGLWEQDQVGSWSRTSLFFAIPLMILIVHRTLDDMFGVSLFKKEREKSKKEHDEAWGKVAGIRYSQHLRSLQMPRRATDFCAVWLGSRGDRYGVKEFWAFCKTTASPLDLLLMVSQSLTQSHLTQPWRVTAQLRHGTNASDPITRDVTAYVGTEAHTVYAHETARVGFVATGTYGWDDQSFLARTADGVRITGDVSQMKGGTSQIHLECMAITTNDQETCALRFRFSERSHPMWLRRQSEALVALTIAEIHERLELDEVTTRWSMYRGDWMTYQLLRIPNQGGMELHPACDLSVLPRFGSRTF